MLMLSPDDNDLDLVHDVNMALLDDSDEELGGGMQRMNIKTTATRPVDADQASKSSRCSQNSKKYVWW